MKSACYHHFQLHLLIHVILNTAVSFKGIIKQIGFQILDDKKNSVYIWYAYQYLYLWYPVETTVEERVCKKTSNVQSKKVKVQSCYTPSPKVEVNLHNIV